MVGFCWMDAGHCIASGWGLSFILSFRILAVAILACGGSVCNQAYSRMPLNEMYNDTYGWLSLSNSLYLNIYKILGGRRTDMVWTPKPHTGWAGARNQLQILFTVRERRQKLGRQTAASERKKKQLYNLVYCKRAHFILVFLDVDAGTWGEAAARLQIQFHNMQFHTQFALTKRPRTHQKLSWLTPDWPAGLEGVTLPPREPPWSERRLANSSGARLASQKTGTCFFRSAVFHSSSKTFFAEDQHSPQPDLPTLIYLAKLL